MKNTSTTSNETVSYAVEKFLQSRGYEIIERAYTNLVDFVCTDGDSIIFIAAFASDGVKEEPEVIERHSAEFDMFSFLIDREMETDMRDVRFDAVCLFISAGNKALLRYHKGALDAVA